MLVKLHGVHHNILIKKRLTLSENEIRCGPVSESVSSTIAIILG